MVFRSNRATKAEKIRARPEASRGRGVMRYLHWEGTDGVTTSGRGDAGRIPSPGHHHSALELCKHFITTL